MITVISNTMMNTKNGIIELFKINSDHTLIRVEFINAGFNDKKIITALLIKEF